MKVGVFQGQAIPLDFEHNLALIDAAAAAAARDGVDVLLTPELFATGYAPSLIATSVSPDDVTSIERSLAGIARRHCIPLVYSTPGRGPAADRGITATLVDGTGDIAGGYTKTHLFGPDERAAFHAGDAPPTVVQLGSVSVGLAICYDVEFPEVARAAASRGASVLLVPTAVGAGYENVSLVLVPARALENALTVAYANHAGIEDGFAFSGTSVIADPQGAIVARAGADPSLIVADVAVGAKGVDYPSDRRPELYAAWSESVQQ